MKTNLLSCLLVLFVLLQACNKDDSSVGNRDISLIEVKLPFADKTIVDIDKNEVFELQPEVSQQRELPLSYEWEVDQQIVSTEKAFKYVGSNLGTYKVRLKVSNEDGANFKEFTIRVNSQYEEGLMILAEASNGDGTLSFIPKRANQFISQTPMDAVDINSFAVNNPGLSLGKKPTDIVPRLAQLFVSSEDGGISLLNTKTLELESTIKAPEYPDFKPVAMNIPNTAARSSLVLTRSGKVYSLATLEFIISNFTNADTMRFDMKTQVLGNANFTNNYFWDAKNSKMWNFWYYNSNSGDELKGQELVHFFTSNGRCVVLTKSKTTPNAYRKTVFGELITTFDRKKVDVLEVHEFNLDQMSFNKQSVTLLDDFYFKVVYANSKDIYQWFYSTNDFPKKPYISIDVPGEITCMQKDPISKELYVGVYNKDAAGLKGSILVYNLDTGAKKASFAAIADKPVKIMFKKRS